MKARRSSRGPFAGFEDWLRIREARRVEKARNSPLCTEFLRRHLLSSPPRGPADRRVRRRPPQTAVFATIAITLLISCVTLTMSADDSPAVFAAAAPTLLSERRPVGLAPMGASRRLKRTTPSTNEH